jgi:Fic family protein
MLFRSADLDELDLKVIREIERLRNQLGYLVGQPKVWRSLLRRNAFARAVRGSNAIEGLNVTLDDAIAAVVGGEPIDAKDEAWLATVGYRDAMTFVLQKTDDATFTFSPEVLKSLHFMMVRYDLAKNPGLWRPGAIFVRNERTGEVVYEGPPYDEVVPLIDELVADLNAPMGNHPLVKAALAHLNLVMIHPFSDGNGRMARCLQTLVLCRSGIREPLFASIEEYLGVQRNTQAYYDVLAAVGEGSWHPERDTRPWMRFCLRAHYTEAMTLLRRSREMEKMCDELETVVRRLGLPERSVLALADAAVGHKVRNPTYRNAADVSDVVAGRDLRALVEAGLLEPHGRKRGRFYVAAPPVMAVKKRVAESKTVSDPFARPEVLATNLVLPVMEAPATKSSSTWPPRRS